MSTTRTRLPRALARMRRDAWEGLNAPAKTLPCRLLYDEAGCALFDQICRLPEYYPTRTELGIMRDHLDAIRSAIGTDARVVELGSGSGLKTRLLLRDLRAAEYIPIDIANEQLQQSARAIAQSHPALRVTPLCTDYTKRFRLPPPGAGVARTVIYFPGSTIGNFEPADAERFLARMAELAGAGGGLLIGVDLQKDSARLERAYNDDAGVTALFNLNLLVRLNRELGTDFDLAAFRHQAIYNAVHHRIEMHLISQRAQVVTLPPDCAVHFAAGESIVTEHSYKYAPDGFAALAARAGWRTRDLCTDRERLFGLFWCDRV